MDDNSGKDFFIGLLFGAVVGLAIGFLYAPKPGKETREIIKEKVEDWREKASDLVDKVKEKTAGQD
jgi:gas vesicle protein